MRVSRRHQGLCLDIGPGSSLAMHWLGAMADPRVRSRELRRRVKAGDQANVAAQLATRTSMRAVTTALESRYELH